MSIKNYIIENLSIRIGDPVKLQFLILTNLTNFPISRHMLIYIYIHNMLVAYSICPLQSSKPRRLRA